MSDWIDINEQKPEEMRAVFVRGLPYSNEGELRSVAVMDWRGDFYAVGNAFGWVKSYDEAEKDTMDDLEGVTHWAPLPDFMYA